GWLATLMEIESCGVRIRPAASAQPGTTTPMAKTATHSVHRRDIPIVFSIVPLPLRTASTVCNSSLLSPHLAELLNDLRRAPNKWRSARPSGTASWSSLGQHSSCKYSANQTKKEKGRLLS